MNKTPKEIIQAAIKAGLIQAQPSVMKETIRVEHNRTAEVENLVGFRGSLGFKASLELSKIDEYGYSVLLAYVNRDHPGSKGFIQTLIERMANWSQGEHSYEMFQILESELAQFNCPKDDVPGNSNFALFWGKVRTAKKVKLLPLLKKKRSQNRKFEEFKPTPTVRIHGFVHRRPGHT